MPLRAKEQNLLADLFDLNRKKIWGGRGGGGRAFKTRTVRTLPPTTAALSEGDRNDLGGMRTSIGLRQPWFKGMSSEIRQRRQ